MHYSIFLSRQANKFLKDADKKLYDRITDLLHILIKNPLPTESYDIAPIKGLKKWYRIRLGKHRIVIQLIPSQKEINVLKIDKRGGVYKDL